MIRGRTVLMSLFCDPGIASDICYFPKSAISFCLTVSIFLDKYVDNTFLQGYRAALYDNKNIKIGIFRIISAYP